MPFEFSDQDSWVKNSSGLYVPSPAISSPEVASASSRPGEERKVITLIQVFAALFASILAVPAIFVAIATFSDQKEINVSQRRLNERLAVREDRRDALQVSWWVDEKHRVKDMVLSGGMLHVQNRSRIPLRNVYSIASVSGEPADPARFNHQPRLLPVLDIPPCSIATMNLPSGGSIWGLYGPWEEGSELVYRFSHVIFTQGSQTWKMTATTLGHGADESDSVSHVDVSQQSVITRLVSTVKIRDASDCGSDG